MTLERYAIRQDQDGRYVLNTRDLNSTDPEGTGSDRYLTHSAAMVPDAAAEMLGLWIFPREVIRITAGEGFLVVICRRRTDMARDYATAENAYRAERGTV